MNRTDRLTGIILALQQGRQTAAQLAARFEVSRRTILRDVDALSQIGVPVVAMSGSGGGLGLVEDYWLKPVQLTTAEASALLLAAQSITGHPSGPLAQPGRSAVDKLRSALRPEVLNAADQDLSGVQIAPPRRADRLGHFQIVHGAIAAETWLRIDYQSLRRVATHVILPSALTESDGFWYCSAVSLEARAVRQYRLDRITSVTPVAAPGDADVVLRAAWAPRPAYDDPDYPEVVVVLTYYGARMAEDLPHGGDAVRQVADSTWELRFRCPLGELDYWARALFGFGHQARVTAPTELRDKIRDLIRAAAAVYDDVESGDATLTE